MKIRAALAVVCALGATAAAETRHVGPGVYHPAFRSERVGDVNVPAFWLDRTQVTSAEFLAFVTRHPEWRRDRASKLLVDDRYLASWAGPVALGTTRPRAPIVDVSWFAARAYCASVGGRLPSEAEWELAAAEPGSDEQILAWYSQPAPTVLPDVGQRMNARGIYDLHGLVWEWTSDFSATILGTGDGAACAAESEAARDPTAYATFMRFAFRSSLEGKSTTHGLGFRCAYDGPIARAPRPAAKRAATPASEPGIYALKLDLRDAAGRPITLDVDRGHRTLVGMFYGSCVTACPALIGELSVALGQLPPGKDVRVLLVSFDPERDTPARLQQLIRDHRLDARWTLAAPRNDDDARALGALLGTKFRKLDNGEFWHTSVVLAVDEHGVPMATMTGLGKHAPLITALSE